jgi:hypothetical protein
MVNKIACANESRRKFATINTLSRFAMPLSTAGTAVTGMANCHYKTLTNGRSGPC